MGWPSPIFPNIATFDHGTHIFNSREKVFLFFLIFLWLSKVRILLYSHFGVQVFWMITPRWFVFKSPVMYSCKLGETKRPVFPWDAPSCNENLMFRTFELMIFRTSISVGYGSSFPGGFFGHGRLSFRPTDWGTRPPSMRSYVAGKKTLTPWNCKKEMQLLWI